MSDHPTAREKALFSQKTERFVALFPILAGFATAVFALGGFLIAYLKDIDARERDSRKGFNELQLKLYSETAKVAGVLATTKPPSPEWSEAKRRFYSLYWSELSMVEDRGVEEAMVYLERSLRNYRVDWSLHQQVRIQAYCLSHALKASVSTSWTVDLIRGQPEPPKDGGRKSCDPVQLLSGAATNDPGID